MSAGLLEPCVEDIVFDLLGRRRRAPEVQLRDAEHRVAAAQAALAGYRDSERVRRALGERAFADGLATRVERLRSARTELAAIRARHATHGLPATSEIDERWPSMDVNARRDIIRRVIDVVFVEPGRRRVHERVSVCPVGTAPANLPRMGSPKNKLRRYARRAAWITPDATGGPARTWSHARIETELRAFVGRRALWPSRETFQAAGRGRLHRQVMLQGGEGYWALRVGVPLSRSTSTPWTDERVRQTLELYLDGTDAWPTWAEFRRDGMQTLRWAIAKRGGAERSAAEMNMPRVNRLNGKQAYWTDARIAERLRTMCRGRATFPSSREFRRAGLSGMHTAVQRPGGIPSWAARVDLPMQGPRHPRSAPRSAATHGSQ